MDKLLHVIVRPHPATVKVLPGSDLKFRGGKQIGAIKCV